MTNATLTLTADTDARADDDLGLPGWVYRSEAFAEDLLDSEVAGRAQPMNLRRLLPGVLYPATLLLAVLATLPSALLSV
jgi:hypothetical protein